MARTFFFKSLLTGIHHGLMLIAFNIIITFGLGIIFPQETPQALALILSVVAAIYVFRRMNSVILERHDRIKEEIKKILEQ